MPPCPSGLPSCPPDYTPLLESGYTCVKLSPDPGTYMDKNDDCYSDGPNTRLATVTSDRVLGGMVVSGRIRHFNLAGIS